MDISKPFDTLNHELLMANFILMDLVRILNAITKLLIKSLAKN